MSGNRHSSDIWYQVSWNNRRKARLVVDGHKTDTPSSVTYNSVVSIDSMLVCLIIAVLNDLELHAADIENPYLTALCKEKCWTGGGVEFGDNKGAVFIISWALYGIKSSSAAFRSFLADKLDDMRFQSSLADTDVRLRPNAILVLMY